MTILIFGHKNPDTDSITSSIALSYLYNKLNFETIPCVLGKIPRESQFVLDYFKLSPPKFISDVKIQVKDLQYNFSEGMSPNNSILFTYQTMKSYNLETVGIVNESNRLLGIISMKDIAKGVIDGNFYHLETSLDNLVRDLDGEVLTKSSEYFNGTLSVIAFYYKTVQGLLDENVVVIVGDRYDIIDYAIECKVQLIIVTGGNQLPNKYIELAKSNSVTIISVPKDTYYISKMIHMCNYSSSIMRTKDVVRFNEIEYLEDVKEELNNSHFRNYPIIDNSNKFLGFINRNHIMNPSGKKVVLVDHNEYAQSAEGLIEAEITAIIDHHKIGDISTSMPINFRNLPVGSTCTIVYLMYQEYNVNIPYNMAGALLSGILSDTLLLKSPTTTEIDVKTVQSLNDILDINLSEYGMDMFKYGTSLEGQSIEEVFHKDFKEFQLENYKTGISQVFTLDIDGVFNRKNEYLEYITSIHQKMNNDITLLLVTDILNEGSYLLYQCKNNNIITSAFEINNEQGLFAKGIVSRKKQVVPKLLNSIILHK